MTNFKRMESNISEIARSYAVRCHSETNHFYDKDKPYDIHLAMVKLTAVKFRDLITEKDRETVYAGCWVHDVIEDCRQTYNDVREATNKDVADLAYALTNEKGRNRAERGSSKYYADMKRIRHAMFIKICDRIANVEYSKNHESPMLKMYAKEQQKFENNLCNERYEIMFEYLRALFT